MTASPRLRAFLIHGFISILFIVVLTLLVFYIWFPEPLAKAVGVSHILFIVFTTSIVLGPILTLIVYKEKKKTLKFDMTVIIILQLVALLYGIWIIYQGKPAWLVYSADRFDVVLVNEIDNRRIEEAQPEYQHIPLFKPEWVGAVAPTDIEENNTLTFEAIFAGVDIAQRPNLYVPLYSQHEQMKKHAKQLDLLNLYNDKIVVNRVLEKYPNASTFLPMKAPEVDMTVLIDDDSHVVALVDLRPWE